MPGWIGPWELLIIAFVVLLVFGPKRLPGLGRSLGKGMRELKEALTAHHDENDDKDEQVAISAAPPERRDRQTVG